MKKFYYLFLVVVLSMGCPPKSSIIQPWIQFSDTEDAFSEPNQLYKPGDIVARNKDNGRMIKLSEIKVEIITSKTIGSYYTKSIEADALTTLKFLGLEKIDLDFSASDLKNKTIQFEMRTDNTFTSTIDGLSKYNEVAKGVVKEIEESLKIYNIDDKTYEVIILTEVRKAQKMDFKIKKSVVKTDSLKFKFKDIVDSRAEYKWDENSDYQLTFDKKEPFNISFQKLPMFLVKGMGGNSYVIGNPDSN